ncbi:hypothetical protein OPQ81_001815 [Rhizoctonia solani]|nr:hypothetical protein OPQ81_001815 [Rhizoctonia solani]
MPPRQTTTLRTYGSRGPGTRTNPLSDDIIAGEVVSACSVSDSRTLEGTKTSFSGLKRKYSTASNLHSFFGGSQTFAVWNGHERSEAWRNLLVLGTSDVEIVKERCLLPNGEVGRIVRIRCNVTKGKLGQKVAILLSTINKALSAPSMPESSLHSSKAYVMIVPGSSPKPRTKNKPLANRSNVERIVGCVITTHITSAMRIVDNSELKSSDISKSDLVCVDIDDSRGNVYCDPKPIPATLGIPRLFVVPSHRRQGIAQALLNAAARTAIWGCPLDPASGQIAFSQPTASGRAVMKAWGGHNIHIYDEQ